MISKANWRLDDETIYCIQFRGALEPRSHNEVSSRVSRGIWGQVIIQYVEPAKDYLATLE